jgi:hypothetical protein
MARASACIRPNLRTSIGRERIVEDMSVTMGTAPAGGRISRPLIVSLEQWKLGSGGFIFQEAVWYVHVVGLGAVGHDAALRTTPASLLAFFDQLPVTVVRGLFRPRDSWEQGKCVVAPPCMKRTGILRDVHEFAQIGFRLLGNLDERLAAVTDFHHRHAKPLPVDKFGLGLLQYFERQHGWTRAEIDNPCHLDLSVC